MRKFKSLKKAQLLLSCFANIYNHFDGARHLCSARIFLTLAERRFKEWNIIIHVIPKIKIQKQRLCAKLK